MANACDAAAFRLIANAIAPDSNKSGQIAVSTITPKRIISDP